MEVNGLPLHILLAHFVIVLVPLAALAAVLVALWPAARRRIGVVAPLLALVNVILVPVVTDAGLWLRERLPDTPLIQEHAERGPLLYPWTIVVFAFTALQWGWFFFVDRPGSSRRPSAPVRWVATTVLAVLAVGLAAISITEVILIGESGSRSVWENSFSPTPLPAPTP